jgi:hypothetical protein
VGRFFIFFDNNLIWIFKIRNSKNRPSLVILFLGDFKNCQAWVLKTQRGAIVKWGWGLEYVISQV